MDVLIFGAAGMVGQALVAEARQRGIVVAALGRSDADITDNAAVADAVRNVAPSLVINSAAMVDLEACEQNPDLADRVNGEAVGNIASAARAAGAKFVQISTDQYFTGDGDKPHDEAAPVTLVNEYAKSKYTGEKLALQNADALVVRTNVTGFRGNPARPTFIEWAINAIQSGGPVSGFADYYTSTLDAGRLAAALFDLVEKGASGVFNVASREVGSKFAFLQLLATGLSVEAGVVTEGSLSGQNPRRAESLGLDVTKAEAMLGYRLPTQSEVITSLLQRRRDQA